MKRMLKSKQSLNLPRLILTNQARNRIMLSAFICSAFGQAQALPFGEQVQAGSASFVRNAQSLNINQTSQKAIVNWQSFSIAADEAVRLNQPNQGIALFRVIGSDPSLIFGNLSATGSLFLSNPNGVLFGRGAQVDVGSLVATSMRINDNDFLAGNYQFHADSDATVNNQGVIRTEDGGYIALLGGTVENSGTLQANNGSVILGSAQSAMLDFYGDGLVRVKLDGDALNAVIKQTGNITADGGEIQLATNARTAAINVDGVIQANSLVERNGVIRLEGGNNAKVSIHGKLSAAGNEAGITGGIIEATGEQVALFKAAKLDASGDAGGGTVLVGGDYQGKNAKIYNSRTTYMDSDASINVDAKNQGNGGKAIVWSNDITRYYGNISAQGGINGGNGGFVEVSGRQSLDFVGKVNLSASNGMGGIFLLDPTNITFNTTTQASPPNNANGTPDIAFGDTPANTIVQISDITGFSEAYFQATNDITIASALTMAANNSIRLEADNNINVNAAVAVSGTGNINFKANADAVGAGNLAIGGNITSQVGGISLSGATITRSAGNITSTGASNGDAGNISITSTGTTNLGAATVTANGGTASAGNAGRNGGTITISAAGYTGTGVITASGSAGSGANTNGGNAGSISVNSTNGISMGAATASGGNAGMGNGNGGNAGVIAINNGIAGAISTGALASRTGNAIGTGAGSSAATVTVANTASGNVTTGAITTTGGNNGNGGNVTLNSTVGNISVGVLASNGGTALSGNSGKNAGAINISAGGSFTGTTIAASGSNGLGTSQSGGNAANITIGAIGGITTTTVAASGGAATASNGSGGNAASISLTNSGTGNITTTTITARNGNAAGTGTGGAVGAINIANNAAAGNVTTTTLSTQGGTLGHGGNISLSALGNVSVNSSITTSGGTSLTGNAGRNAGAINISAGGNAVTGAIASTGSAGLGTNQNGGTASTVNLSAGAGNTITHANIDTRGGARTGIGIGGNGGTINVNSNALLSANTAITATGAAGGGVGGNVNLAGSIDSSGTNRTLAINTNGATTINGAIGNTLALSSLTTDTGGTTTINGSTVTTTTTQTYNDAVTLGAITNLNTTNSAITFANSINAAGNALTMSAGTGNITATNVANNFSNVAITSANNVSLRDANAIVLGASNVAGTFGVQTTGAITQTGAITVGGATTLNAGTANDITLNDAANNFNAVAITSGRDVTLVDANAIAINTSSVRTISTRTLSNNLTLGGNITATGTGSGTSITLASAQNFLNPGSSNLTPGAGSRWLIYSTNPANDTRGANLLSAYDFKQYNTAFGGAILGSNDGFIYTIAPTITATLSGAATKVYDGNTTAAIGGLTLGQSGSIDGDTVNISAFTSATYDNKNAGTGKTVTSNALSITGATNGTKQVFGYQLSSPTANGNVGTVTPASLSLSGQTANNKVYDATTNATLTGGTLSGVLGTDAVNLVTGTGSFADKNVGTAKAVTVTGTGLSGADAGNYTVAGPIGLAANITPADITAVNGITANNKIYDATNTATINTGAATFTGILGADSLNVATATGNFSDINAGTGKTVNISGISLGGADAGNYNLAATTASATADISQRSITVTANPGQTKIVGNVDPLPFSFTIGGLGLVGGDTLSGSLSRAAGEAVGSYAINQGSLDAGSNYNLTYFSNDFTILLPPVGSGNPRNAAGLVDLNPMLGNYTNQQLFVLNVGFTAAGNDSSGNQEVCEGDPESLAKDKDFILMLNYGLKLPRGVNTSCDKASI